MCLICSSDKPDSFCSSVISHGTVSTTKSSFNDSTSSCPSYIPSGCPGNKQQEINCYGSCETYRHHYHYSAPILRIRCND